MKPLGSEKLWLPLRRPSCAQTQSSPLRRRPSFPASGTLAAASPNTERLSAGPGRQDPPRPVVSASASEASSPAAAAAMEALRTAEAELTVYVHPSNAKRVRHAVSRQLSALLFTYDDRFDGVLLMHEVAFLLGKDKEGRPIYENSNHEKEIVEPNSCVKGKIMNGLVPYFGVQVQATLLLFSPQPDMILEGKVEMLGKESIHAIVLGVFSVAIMFEDIHEKFIFKRKSDGGKFVSRTDKRHVIERGTMIRFSVKRVDTEMNCHITGSLIPPHTGCMRWLSVHDAEYASEIRSGESTSRDTIIKIEQNEQEHGILKNEDDLVKTERPYKSRKRRRIEE